MSGTIKFFHPEETFLYNIEKCFCKVIFSNNQKNLVLEIESTEDLDHVEEDSKQNEFPKVVLNIEDFSVNVESLEKLNGTSWEIPFGTIEQENEEEELIELFLTNLNVNEEYDFETNNNSLVFSDKDGNLRLLWKGEAEDFTEELDEPIPFEVDCCFVPKKLKIID